MTDTERVPVGTIVGYHGPVLTEFTLYLVAGYNDIKAERPDLPADVIEEHWPDNVGYSLFPVGVPVKMDNQHLRIDYVRRRSFDVLGTLELPVIRSVSFRTLEIDPTELLPGDTVLALDDHDLSGCHCDVRVTVRRQA